VLKADGPARRSRLALFRLSAGTLKLGLGLLGIPSLERMEGGERGGEEFRLRLLGLQAGIMPNPCSRVLHGPATVGLMLKIRSGSRMARRHRLDSSPQNLDVRRHLRQHVQ
jgi:hypothetical protein